MLHLCVFQVCGIKGPTVLALHPRFDIVNGIVIAYMEFFSVVFLTTGLIRLTEGSHILLEIR